jgi:hypothetical protein
LFLFVCLFGVLVVFVVFFCVTGDWTQSLTHACKHSTTWVTRPALILSFYLLRIIHILFLSSAFFSTLSFPNKYLLALHLFRAPIHFLLDEFHVLKLESPPKSCLVLPIPVISRQVLQSR